jgi:hypothetical protein
MMCPASFGPVSFARSAPWTATRCAACPALLPDLTMASLITAIETYIDGWNDRCQPFTWTKTADEILAKATGGQRTSFTRHQPPGPVRTRRNIRNPYAVVASRPPNYRCRPLRNRHGPSGAADVTSGPAFSASTATPGPVLK